MEDERNIALTRATLLKFPNVIGVGYGLKETAGNLTRQLAWRVYVQQKKPRSQLRQAEIIPPHIYGLRTDIIAHTPVSVCTISQAAQPRAGAMIANSRGVPGTLGCVARTIDDGSPVLLSNWHVLFGNGAPKDGTVWLVDEIDGSRRFLKLGKTLYGKIGIAQLGGKDYYVDCAVGSCSELPKTKFAWQLCQPKLPISFITGCKEAQPGQKVMKMGAATGLTVGIVADVTYPDFVWIEGLTYSAQHQILISSIDNQTSFSAEGDSGAVIIDAESRVVGLLWGTNSRGQGVASPIAPVLHTMNITLDLQPYKWLLVAVSFISKHFGCM